MEIIAANGTMGQSIKSLIVHACRDDSFERLKLVYIDSSLDVNQELVDKHGLAIAKKLAEDLDNIVILCALEVWKFFFADDMDFSALMALPNVDFVHVLHIGDDLADKYESLALGKKKKDEAMLAICEAKVYQRQMEALQSQFLKAEMSPTQFVCWTYRARQAGLQGSEKEIIEQVRKWSAFFPRFLNGRFFEGIFVDRRSLFNPYLDIIVPAQEEIEAMAQRLGFEVYVLCEDDLLSVKQALLLEGLTWAAVPKRLMGGATLHTLVDTLEAKHLLSMYSISAQNFILASELIPGKE